jgi:hypothetical protein
MIRFGPVPAAAAGALLLAGCTSTLDSEPQAAEKVNKSPGVSPSASASRASEPYTLPEDRAPRTRAEAVAFVRDLGVRSDYFGAGYRKRDPFESDPATWAVLGEDCTWRREALPHSVLASITQSFELPEKGGKGPVYVSLTVTVHKDTTEARRGMARALESSLRCPEQRLNATDRVRDLYSRADAFADARPVVTEDDLTEIGKWISDGESTAYPFDWFKYRVGTVTVSATARHGAGRSVEEDAAITSDVATGVGLVAAGLDRRGKAADGGTGDEPTRTKGTQQ